MPLCKPCLSSRSRGVLVFLLVFLLIYAVIYNYYIQGSQTAFITDLEVTTNALNATRVKTSNASIALSPTDCPSTPPTMLDVKSLAKLFGTPTGEWMNKPIINPFPYRFVHNPCKACGSKDVEVLLCVPVSRKNFKERQTIRETWGEYAYDPKHKAVLLFFLGGKTENESVDVQKEIDKESASRGDIVQVDFEDSYRNLSLKSMSILRWVDAYCPQVVYLVKADDDMYIAVPHLLDHLRETSKRVVRKLFVVGYKIIGAKPVQDKSSKWYTPKEHFAEKKYPAYASGTSYTMSGKTARMLLRAALRTPLFWLEDIYITGLCSRQAGIMVVDDETMTYDKPPAVGCKFRAYTTGHRYSMEEIRKIHRELYNKDLNCDGTAKKKTTSKLKKPQKASPSSVPKNKTA